ncbi:hypothetical protein QOT17_000671 [Balamuthia mandrillaris]
MSEIHSRWIQPTNGNISCHHQEDAFSAPPLYFLSLHQQVTKGIPNHWNHVVTFEGYLTPPPPPPSSSSRGSSSSPSPSSSSPLSTTTAMTSTVATTTTATTSTTSTASICLGDFIYWLNKHLLCKHGLDLHKFHNWHLMDAQIQTSLWGWSRDTLNAKLQDQAVRAGYPEGLFSFHSLHAGFLCTALILEGLQEGHS